MLQNQRQRAFAVIHLYLEIIPAVALQCLPVNLLYQVPLLDDAVMGGYLAQLSQDVGADNESLSLL